MLSFRRLRKSFKYAIRGFLKALKEEQNLQIHVMVSIFVLALGFWLGIDHWEFVLLILMIIAILILEIINTVFERLTDMLKPRRHLYVEIIKDMMAATVLIASVGAVIIGSIIFYPYLEIFLK